MAWFVAADCISDKQTEFVDPSDLVAERHRLLDASSYQLVSLLSLPSALDCLLDPNQPLSTQINTVRDLLRENAIDYADLIAQEAEHLAYCSSAFHSHVEDGERQLSPETLLAIEIEIHCHFHAEHAKNTLHAAQGKDFCERLLDYIRLKSTGLDSDDARIMYEVAVFETLLAHTVTMHAQAAARREAVGLVRRTDLLPGANGIRLLVYAESNADVKATLDAVAEDTSPDKQSRTDSALDSIADPVTELLAPENESIVLCATSSSTVASILQATDSTLQSSDSPTNAGRSSHADSLASTLSITNPSASYMEPHTDLKVSIPSVCTTNSTPTRIEVHADKKGMRTGVIASGSLRAMRNRLAGAVRIKGWFGSS